jgi:aquaporin Z
VPTNSRQNIFIINCFIFKKNFVMKRYLTEFIGTFFLVLVVSLTANNPFGPIAIGTILMVMVYAGGHISGAHYNPAVTLAVLYRRKIELKEAIIYWMVQIVAGCVAGFTAIHLSGNSPSIALGIGRTNLQAILTEVCFTFALAYVVLNVATHSKTQGNSYFGLAIGFTILVGAFAGGPISGGAFNPAVGTGITFAHAMWGGGSWEYLWIYLVGPIVGGGLAGVVFDYINADEL